MARPYESLALIDQDVDVLDMPIGEDQEIMEASMDAQTEKSGEQAVATGPAQSRNMIRVQEGALAFMRDRDKLIECRKLNQIVAYEGEKRIAIEPTHKKLHKRLDKIKGLKRSDLFITCVVPSEDDDVVLSR